MANKLYEESSIQAIANAIRAKSGSSGTMMVSEMATAINNIPSGGSIEENDVNFYDYDGTLVASYTAAAFLDLENLPANPSHSGLTAQGWNWTLTEAKSYVTNHGTLDVGQTYTTDDGLTRIYFTGKNISFNIPSGAVVDWGDESETETGAGASKSHTYSKLDDYVITLDYSEATSFILPTLGGSSSPTAAKKGIKKIEVGNYVTTIAELSFRYLSILEILTIPNTITSFASTNTFSGCHSLKTIIIPRSLTTLPNYSFSTNFGLEKVILPGNMTSIGTNCFANCHSLERIIFPDSISILPNTVCNTDETLKEVILPNSLTTLGNQTFYSNYSLTEIIIPENVTTIELQQQFYNCANLTKIVLLPETPPSLANANTFTNINSDAVFVVPVGTLEDYQTAANWSTYASQMVEAIS